MSSNTIQDKSKNLIVFQVCFYVTIISNLIIYIAQPLHIVLLETLASRCFILSNLVALFFVFNHCIKEYLPYKTQQMLTIFFILGYSLISYLMSNGSSLYTYLIRIFCYLALPIYFLYLDYLKPDKRMLNAIFLINILISIVFISLSFSKYKYAGYESFIGTDRAWLTLGYFNPNQTAMYLVITTIILLCTLYYYKNKGVKIILLIDIVYLVTMILQTSSRTSICVVIFILVVTLLKRRTGISKFMVLAILALPLFFILLYPFLYEHGWIYLFEYGGKADYSSRSDIFQSILASLKNQFLFGDFGTYQLQNLHNGILSVYSSLGVVGLVLFYLFYGRAFLHIQERQLQSKTAYTSMIGLLSIFLHACTESAFLVGGSMYAGSLSILILLVRLEDEGEKSEKDNLSI